MLCSRCGLRSLKNRKINIAVCVGGGGGRGAGRVAYVQARGKGKSFQDSRKSNFTAKCLNTNKDFCRLLQV